MRKLVFAMTLSFLAACGSGNGQRKTAALAPPDTVIEPYAPLAIYGTRTVGGTPTTGALDAAWLKNALYSICWSQVEAALPDFCPNSGPLDDNGCLGHQCLMQVHICVGNKYMEIAEETNELSFTTLLLTGSDPYTLPLAGSPITYDIPPQSAANRTLAFDLAVTAFSKGGERAVSAISSTTPNCFTTTGGINFTVTENDIKKNRARVFATTYADTIQALVEAAHRFAGNSLQVAGIQRQRVRDYGQAGQWLWNGRVNSVRAVAAAMGNDDDGPAADITLPTCIPSLRNKASMQASIALQRRVALAETLGSTTTENFISSVRNALHTANPGLEFGVMSNDEFLDRFGLSRADIADGRQYLQEEHDTFQRTDVETFPGSGRIAGIATEPRELPAAAAIARTAGTRLQTTSTVAQTTYRASGILQMLDYLRWGVRRAFRVSALPSAIQPAFRAAQAIAEAETGTHRVSVVSNGATSVKVNVHGVSSSDKFVVVNGLDGARCLSEGAIEGAPCDPADYILDSTGTFASGDPGYVHELSNTLTYHVGTTGVQSLYLLSADGKWTALAGIDPGGIPGTANAILTPIGGGMTREMALALAPHPQECGETQQDCVGLPADLVVPLESELTENNDPYENSWLHYLDLAEQMALEADALGEDLIEAGLVGDLRAEAARDELEGYCGGVQNVGTTCDADAGSRDESLETCLSDGTENQKVPWMTLGDVGLCVPAGNSNPECRDCPLPINDQCEQGFEPVRPLGLIEAVQPVGGPHCEQLADLVEPNALQGSARRDRIAELLQGTTRWANRQELERLMNQTTYDEDELNHLEVSLGGATIVSLRGSNRFPCDLNWANADQRLALRKVSPDLFNYQCDLSEVQRGEYITAFRRAYGTLRLLTGGMEGTMSRSWISPVSVSDCGQDEVQANLNNCAWYDSPWMPGIGSTRCDDDAGCLCRNDNPSPPWHYGNVPCAEGARHELEVGGDSSEVSGGDWAHLWSFGEVIDCFWQRDEDPMLEAVLCETPSNHEFGNRNQNYWHNRNFYLGRVPFVGQPEDLVAPVEDELDPDADAKTITRADIYSALALGCYLRWSGEGECPDFDPATPPPVPEINQAGDLAMVESRIQCAAKAVRSTAGRVLLANVPEVVVKTIKSGDIRGLYPQYRGEHLEALVAIQKDLNQLASLVVNLDLQLQVARTQTGHARAQLAGIQLQGEIQDLQNIVNILSLASNAASSAIASFGASAALAVPQIVLAAEIEVLQDRLEATNVEGVLTDYSTQVATILSAIHQIGLDLNDTVYSFNADLGRLESIESRADSAAAITCFIEEDEQNGRLFPVTSVIRRRYDTLRIRYERARDRAREMAFVARRAIEQRFGLILSQMNEEMTLVEAPATWARDVCEFEGIDYERIREAVPPEEAPAANFADGYLGDYVEKLRLFVESYPFDFPFQDGTDLAVISLREDVLRARAYCEAPVPNLLASSDSVLGHVDQMGESVNAWLITSCPDPDLPCVLLDTRPDMVIAGRNASRVADAPVSTSARTGVLVQDVPIDSAGLYILSWMDKFVGTTDGVRDVGVPAAVPYRVTLERVGSDETVSEVDAPGDALNAPELHELVLDVSQAGVLRVTIDPGESSETKGDAWFAELQLEMIQPNLDPVRSEYVPTTSGGMGLLEVCADIDGAVMRDRFFQHRYERLCSGGIEEGCGDRGERVQSNPGFWETGFAIGLEQIERGELIPSGAIALGNYNYRHELVGVNLVGTNVRDCSASQEPSSCYSNAFIPISLIHAGEARIRNHTGDDVAFDFGRGTIEHGKALASEVMLTNPLTGAMETLLQPYYKEELRGRPLTGEYWLRIWDDPALNWNNVEDVQLVFRYRYWTRFGE